MAKEQKIKTTLTGDSRGLVDALDTAQSRLVGLSDQAKKTGSAVQQAFASNSAAGRKLADGIQTAAGQGLSKALGLGGASSTLLQSGVRALFASGLNLALPALGAGLAGLAAQFGSALADRISQAREISTGAEATGGDTDLYQRIRRSAEKTGASVDTLTAAYAKFQSTLEAARNGSMEAREALAKLGYQTDDLTQDSQGFLQALGSVATATDRDATAMAIFGTNTREAQRAFADLAATSGSADGIIGRDAIDDANRLAEAWDRLKEAISSWSAETFEPIASGWRSMVDGIISGTADALEGMAALADMPQELSDADLAEELARRQEELARRQEARRAAEQERRDRERNERNERANRQTIAYQEQQQREALRLARQRAKINREYELAGMSPDKRRQAERREYTLGLMGMGYNEREAEAITRRLWDPRQAGKSPAVAAPAAPPPAAPGIPTGGVGLDAVIREIRALRSNTYVVK
jgi:hypothetical protein